MDSRVDWSKLPDEIWSLIGKHLKTRIEVLRFRSVCSSWRSIPDLPHSFVPKIPFPFSTRKLEKVHRAFLSQSTIYILRVGCLRSKSSSSSSSSMSWSSKGCLLKVEDSSEKLRLLNPISSCRIRYLNDVAFPEDLNLLDFNMVELSKTYALKYVTGSGPVHGLNKVVLLPNFENCVILVIYNQGKLGFAKTGDDQLTPIKDYRISDFNDIIVYKGQPYVVDKQGTVSWIDPSLKLVRFSPFFVCFGQRKHLVESCGELYVIDRYLKQEANMQNDRDRLSYRLPKAVDFKVYKLDEEWGRWVEVKSLGDQAFFLNVDCSFSVSAGQLAGCKGNCIYFTDQNDVGLALRKSNGQDGFVFNLEDHSIESLGSSPGYSRIFWPPPTGLLGKPM